VACQRYCPRNLNLTQLTVVVADDFEKKKKKKEKRENIDLFNF
jgi:hypothetical protein